MLQPWAQGRPLALKAGCQDAMRQGTGVSKGASPGLTARGRLQRAVLAAATSWISRALRHGNGVKDAQPCFPSQWVQGCPTVPPLLTPSRLLTDCAHQHGHSGWRCDSRHSVGHGPGGSQGMRDTCCSRPGAAAPPECASPQTPTSVGAKGGESAASLAPTNCPPPLPCACPLHPQTSHITHIPVPSGVPAPGFPQAALAQRSAAPPPHGPAWACSLPSVTTHHL